MFGGLEQVVHGNASAVYDPSAEICVSGLQFQKCEALNTSARVQALFCENFSNCCNPGQSTGLETDWVYFCRLSVDLGKVTELSCTSVSSSVKQGQ